VMSVILLCSMYGGYEKTISYFLISSLLSLSSEIMYVICLQYLHGFYFLVP